MKIGPGEEQRVFSVTCCSDLWVGEICYLLTQGLEERKCMEGVEMEWRHEGMVYFYGRPVQASLDTQCDCFVILAIVDL